MIYQGAFEKAYAFTKPWEGGYVDNKNDPGGATNFGISLRFLKNLPIENVDFHRDGIVNWQDIKDMTPEQAEDLFCKYFWYGGKLDLIGGLKTTCAMFDTAVNSGEKEAVLFAQRAIGGLDEDGILGKITCAAIRVACENDDGDTWLSGRIIDQRLAFDEDVIARHPEIAYAKKGWENRCAALREYIAKL